MLYIKQTALAFVAGALFCCSCTSQPAQQQSEARSSDTVAKVTDKHTDTAAAVAGKKSILADQLIVPGKSAGLTHIGEDMTEVYKRLGKPDADDAAMGHSMAFWYAGHDSTGYKTAVFAGRDMGNADENTNRAKQILVTSPFFKTADGIHTGSSYRQAGIHYQLKKATTFGKGPKQLTVYDDKEQGIAFEFSADRLCKGIIVHAPGTDGGLAYLAFHPELETPPNPPQRGGL